MKNEIHTADWVLIALVILFFGWLLTGCTTEKKAVRYMNAHGFQAAEYCAGAYPVKDSTIYLPGQTIVVRHTDTIPGEVIPCPEQQPGQPAAVVHCPPSIVTHDTATPGRHASDKNGKYGQNSRINGSAGRYYLPSG